MNRTDLYTAFGEIEDDILVRSEHEKKADKSILLRWGTIAACFLLLVSMALTAEAATGAVSNLLAPLFGAAQTEIVNNIGVPVGVSTSADGYTLTCDAIIGDRYNVGIVYTLSRDDGQPIPEGVSFGDGRTDIRWGGSGGGSRSHLRHKEDPSQVYFIEQWSHSSPIIGRLATASYAQLEIRNENGERTILANGPWELHYTLRYKDATTKVKVNRRNVTNSSGETYRIDKILLSPIGLHIDVRWYDPRSFAITGCLCPDFQVSIKFTDGTSLLLEHNNKSGHFAQGDKTANMDYSAWFDEPIDLGTIQALIICDCEYPVAISS